jgi:hypothetical protein
VPWLDIISTTGFSSGCAKYFKMYLVTLGPAGPSFTAFQDQWVARKPGQIEIGFVGSGPQRGVDEIYQDIN